MTDKWAHIFWWLGYWGVEADQIAEDIEAETGEPVPYDDPRWESDDTWELGPCFPQGATLIPPELDLEFELDGDDQGYPWGGD